MLDKMGTPLKVSAVVIYQIIDTYKAGIKIMNINEYVNTQGEAVLRNVCARYV